MRYLFPLLMTAVCCAGLLAAEGPDAPRPGELEALIKQLGSTAYAEREDAQLKLAAYGEAARGVLTKALKHADPEISASAALLLDKINRAVVAVQVVDSAGKPLAEAPVAFNIYLRDGRHSVPIRHNETLSTDAEGWACVGNLKPSAGYILNLRCQMPDYVPAMTSQQSLELKVGRHEFKLVALRCAHVTGVVLGRENVPLAGCRVGLVPTSRLRMLENPKQARFALRSTPVATANERGQFTFEQVLPGDYVVALMAEEKLLYKSEQIRVEAEETLSMDALATGIDPQLLKRDEDVLTEDGDDDLPDK